MMDGEDALRFCLKHRITIEQFFILYLLARKDFQLPDKQSLGKMYIYEMGQFGHDAVEDLVERGFIGNFNDKGQYYPDKFILTPIAQAQFADIDMAEELWETYPVTFPLGENKSFISRSGGDKEELLQLYLTRINHSKAKHEFTMAQLSKYVRMVRRGEINGRKLGDWIREEIWDVVAQIPDSQVGAEFGKDV